MHLRLLLCLYTVLCNGFADQGDMTNRFVKCLMVKWFLSFDEDSYWLVSS